MKKIDLDIRYEEIEADGYGDLQNELWRRLYDELFSPDTDSLDETESAFQENLLNSKKILSEGTSPTYPMVKYNYGLFIIAGVIRRSSAFVRLPNSNWQLSYARLDGNGESKPKACSQMMLTFRSQGEKSHRTVYKKF